MNGSTGNTASGAFEKPNRRETNFDLLLARRMLPLIGRIVADMVQARQRLGQLLAEQNHLDRNRRTLAWPERSRRYQLREDVAGTEQQLQAVCTELDNLGAVLVDPKTPAVGFPTVVKGRRAYFSWQPGEDELKYWHFAGDRVRRPIPAAWVRAEDLSTVGKS
jgi:hypothetical protein